MKTKILTLLFLLAFVCVANADDYIMYSIGEDATSSEVTSAIVWADSDDEQHYEVIIHLKFNRLTQDMMGQLIKSMSQQIGGACDFDIQFREVE